MNIEAKIFGMIAALALVVAGAGWVAYSQGASELRSKLVDLKGSKDQYLSSIESLQRQIKDQEGAKARVVAELAKFQEIKDKEASLTNQIEEMKKHTAAMTEATEKAGEDLNVAVMSARRLAVGMKLPAFTLRTGRVLNDVKVQRVAEDMIAVSHSNGSARLHRADLPDEWIEHYQIVPPQPRVAKAPAVPAADGTPPPVEAPPSNAPADPAKVTELRAKIAKLDAQVHILRGQARSWTERAVDLQVRIGNSEAKGRIVTDKSKVDEATANAAKCTAQATALEAEVIALQGTLYSVNAGAY